MEGLAQIARWYVDSQPEWSASEGRPCITCGTSVPVVDAEDQTCPLCWASRHGMDPDRALGQAIAIEGLLVIDSAPDQVAACVQRLRSLSEHAARPAVTALLAHAARDLEAMADQIG